jgi:hypothetical protein
MRKCSGPITWLGSSKRPFPREKQGKEVMILGVEVDMVNAGDGSRRHKTE